MISSGAKGVLCMGSMGYMASLKDSEYPLIAQQASNIVNHRIPLLVGVMDCSIVRILGRINSLKDINIDGVVTTAPFYSLRKPNEIVNFLTKLARESKYPVYVHD